MVDKKVPTNRNELSGVNLVCNWLVIKATNNIKKELLQIRKDPILSQKPHLPIQGPNKGGKMINVAYTPIHHLIQSLNSNP